jgi:hypothetical protein
MLPLLAEDSVIYPYFEVSKLRDRDNHKQEKFGLIIITPLSFHTLRVF